MNDFEICIWNHFFGLVLSSGCMGVHCMLKTYIFSYVQTYCEAVTFSRNSTRDQLHVLRLHRTQRFFFFFMVLYCYCVEDTISLASNDTNLL